MIGCGLDTPVPDWVIEHTESVAVFQELGIDYCPCLLDAFIAAERYMEGSPKKPWDKY